MNPDVEDLPHALYRFYNAARDLLYIGISVIRPGAPLLIRGYAYRRGCRFAAGIVARRRASSIARVQRSVSCSEAGGWAT